MLRPRYTVIKDLGRGEAEVMAFCISCFKFSGVASDCKLSANVIMVIPSMISDMSDMLVSTVTCSLKKVEAIKASGRLSSAIVGIPNESCIALSHLAVCDDVETSRTCVWVC